MQAAGATGLGVAVESFPTQALVQQVGGFEYLRETDFIAVAREAQRWNSMLPRLAR
jgi:hypothetical protein